MSKVKSLLKITRILCRDFPNKDISFKNSKELINDITYFVLTIKLGVDVICKVKARYYGHYYHVDWCNSYPDIELYKTLDEFISQLEIVIKHYLNL